MPTVCEQLIDDHRRCDDLFLSMEKKVGQSKWKEALDQFLAFSTAFQRHIETEESVFFPLIKDVAGEDAWPLKELRAEHAKLEMIMLRLGEAIRNQSKDDFILHAESFFILMHTHSIKEEQILYPELELKKLRTSPAAGTSKDR